MTATLLGTIGFEIILYLTVTNDLWRKVNRFFFVFLETVLLCSHCTISCTSSYLIFGTDLKRLTTKAENI